MSLSRMSCRVSSAHTYQSLEGCMWVPVFTSRCLCTVCSEFVRLGTARSLHVVCSALSRCVLLSCKQQHNICIAPVINMSEGCFALVNIKL